MLQDNILAMHLAWPTFDVSATFNGSATFKCTGRGLFWEGLVERALSVTPFPSKMRAPYLA